MLKLFWIFFKIGLFTFGGGYAMIPLILNEIESFSSLTQDEIIDFIGISESTPGPFAINIATFIGFSQYGILGAIIATIGVALPSFIIILLLVNIIEKVKENRYFKSIIKSTMPIVIGLIIATTTNIILSSIFSTNNLYNIKNEFSLNITTLITLLVTAIIILLLKFLKNKKLAPVFIILISASLGITISCLLF